jgi:hypothetical protein
LRILDIEDRRYNIFIEPDLLASFSLGPVPNFTVKALARANKKRELSRPPSKVLFYFIISPFFFFFLLLFFFIFRVPFVCRCEQDEIEQEQIKAARSIR